MIELKYWEVPLGEYIESYAQALDLIEEFEGLNLMNTAEVKESQS